MYSSKSGHVSNQKSIAPIYNSGKQSSFFKPAIQPKLTINQPDDIYEQEADAMADKVMRMPDTSVKEPFFKPRTLFIQKKCTACEAGEREKEIQMKPADGLIQRDDSDKEGGTIPDDPETKPFQLNVPFTAKMNYLQIVDELSAREVPFISSYYRESSEEYLRQYKFYKSLGLGKIAQKAGTVPVLRLLIPDLPGIDPDAALANITTSISVGNALKRDYRLSTERDDTNIRIFNIKTWRFGGGSKIRRKCAHCEDEEKLHRKVNENGEAEAGNELTNYVGNINSGGTVLPEQVRSFFEPRFGYDFSDVRIHNDSVAAKSAQSINALAYTSGNNIVFNQNQYSPGTDRGKKLLAHELTHVVQQTNSGNNSLISRAVKECEPDHVLTWADYSGAIPRGATVGAITKSGPVKVMDEGKPKFQGILVSADSWALEKHKSASDNSKNGCQQQIDECKTFARNNPRRLPGRTSPHRTGACPASVVPQAVEFRNEAECTSKVGAECKRAILADSALLLKHEKLHFEISCIIAKKGNIEIAKGKDFDKVGEKVTEFQNKININNGSGQGDYDEESKHRCDQAKQDEWNTKVQNSLPGVVLS